MQSIWSQKQAILHINNTNQQASTIFDQHLLDAARGRKWAHSIALIELLCRQLRFEFYNYGDGSCEAKTRFGTWSFALQTWHMWLDAIFWVKWCEDLEFFGLASVRHHLHAWSAKEVVKKCKNACLHHTRLFWVNVHFRRYCVVKLCEDFKFWGIACVWDRLQLKMLKKCVKRCYQKVDSFDCDAYLGVKWCKHFKFFPPVCISSHFHA